MINKVIIIGNLGADVELRYTQSGTPVASFRVATTERWKGQDGQMQEQTEWHSCVAWRRLAEICGEYLGKGSRVYLEGKLQTRKWQDKDGNDRYTTEIVVSEMKMLSPKGEGSGRGSGGYGGDNHDPFPPPPPTGDDVPF
jgi:single-strand DNA-binding protein